MNHFLRRDTETEAVKEDILMSVIFTMVVACAIFGLAFVMIFRLYSDTKSETFALSNQLALANSEIERISNLEETNSKLQTDLIAMKASNESTIEEFSDVAAKTTQLSDDLIKYMDLAAESSLENEVLREYYFRTTGMEVDEIRFVNIEATKYTNAEGWFERGDEHYGMTASGTYTAQGTVAAPKSIPFGTKVLLAKAPDAEDQDRVFTVQDRGSAIIEDSDGEICIDIWIEEENINEAYEFGRQHVEGFLIIPKKEGSDL